MNKPHVRGGLFSLFMLSACHPVGPPGTTRPIQRTTPPSSLSAPSTLNPTATLASPADSDYPAVASPAPTSPAAPPTLQQAAKPSPPSDPYPTAEKAPGKPGYVRSPHTGKLILVDGIPSGMVVPDQTCPPNEKKSFRVP